MAADEARPVGARGSTDAAVLAPLFGLGERPGLVFTERREDLRRLIEDAGFAVAFEIFGPVNASGGSTILCMISNVVPSWRLYS